MAKLGGQAVSIQLNILSSGQYSKLLNFPHSVLPQRPQLLLCLLCLNNGADPEKFDRASPFFLSKQTNDNIKSVPIIPFILA